MLELFLILMSIRLTDAVLNRVNMDANIHKRAVTMSMVSSVDPKMKMIIDLLYEILPMIGFIICASSIFVLYTAKRDATAGRLKFIQFYAVADLVCGVAIIYSGFHGVFITIYGSSVDTIRPMNCFVRALHLIVFLYTDYLHMMLLAISAADRLIQILIPVSYGKLIQPIINWKLFIFVSIVAIFPCTYGLQYSFENRDNSTILVSIQCRLDEVVGEDYYASHLDTLRFLPLVCVAVLLLTIAIFIVRLTKHKWSYNWSEEKTITKQLFASVFTRCLLTALSIHLPIHLMSAYSLRLHGLRDHVIRASFWIIVQVFQPIWNLIILSAFQSNVQSMFNKYSENTERKWQSADDPPTKEENQHFDRHGSPNPFGSWYSTTGNIAGEAGVPIGNERSISFYYDKQ